jgi:hypothetical protein
VPLGEGFLVLYGIRTLHRNQTRGSMAMVWNALLNWDRLGPSSESADVADEATDGRGLRRARGLEQGSGPRLGRARGGTGTGTEGAAASGPYTRPRVRYTIRCA